MCGRYTLKTPAAIIQEVFGLPGLPDIAPRYNVAPTQPVAAVRRQDGQRTLTMLRWGLIPFWADDASIGNRMINARAETVAARPAYREPFERRRCLVLADGFYEWQKLGGSRKQPWHLGLENNAPFAFAGVWDRWRDRRGGETVESCAILTTEPNGLVEPIHDRMPVMLDPEHFDLWFDPQADRASLAPLLAPYPAERMRAYPVSAHVNRPANDDPRCVESVDPEPRPRTLFD